MIHDRIFLEKVLNESIYSSMLHQMLAKSNLIDIKSYAYPKKLKFVPADRNAKHCIYSGREGVKASTSKAADLGFESHFAPGLF